MDRGYKEGIPALIDFQAYFLLLVDLHRVDLKMNKQELHELKLSIRRDLKVLNTVLDLLDPELVQKLQEELSSLKEKVSGNLK